MKKLKLLFSITVLFLINISCKKSDPSATTSATTPTSTTTTPTVTTNNDDPTCLIGIWTKTECGVVSTREFKSGGKATLRDTDCSGLHIREVNYDWTISGGKITWTTTAFSIDGISPATMPPVETNTYACSSTTLSTLGTIWTKQKPFTLEDAYKFINNGSQKSWRLTSPAGDQCQYNRHFTYYSNKTYTAIQTNPNLKVNGYRCGDQSTDQNGAYEIISNGNGGFKINHFAGTVSGDFVISGNNFKMLNSQNGDFTFSPI